MRKCTGLRILLILIAAACVAGISAEKALGGSKLGLGVSKDGLFFKDGKPFRGIGMNYFSIFSRLLASEFNEPEDGFVVLAQYKIPFVRFMACGFWPTDYNLYMKDAAGKAEYFRRLDGIVKAAEDNGVGLIPSLFWAYFAVPDLMGEPMDQWANPQSKTHAFMRQYVTEVVTRYKDSPAIWGWEMGNEWCLGVDLPNASDPAIRPPTWTSLGCPATRSARDEMTHEMTTVAFTEFAKTIRAIDPDRMIVTGNAAPRNCAYHNSLNRTWTNDTRDQFAQILLRDSPDPINAISVHIYEGTNVGCFAGQPVSLSGYMKEIKLIGATAKKPVFIGEFGSPGIISDGQGGYIKNPNEHDAVVELLDAIETNKMPLSAVWDFDSLSPNQTWVKESRIYPGEERGYILDLIVEANKRIQSQLRAEQNGVDPALWTAFE